MRILVRDVKRVSDFYATVVGLHPLLKDERFVVFDDGTGTLMEFDATPQGDRDPPDPHIALTVRVDSLDKAWHAALDVDGLPSAILDEGFRRRFQLVDPEGNVTHVIENTVELREHLVANHNGAARPFLDHLGLRWTFGAGDATVEFDIRDDFRGPGGALQGGATATLIDAAAATSASLALGGARVFTASMTIHFVRPGMVGPIRAYTTPTRVSQRVAFMEVRVVDVGDGEETIATALLVMQARSPSSPDPSTPITDS